MTVKTIQVSIRKLFEALNCDNIAYETPTKPSVPFKIKSKNGFVDVNFLVKKLSKKVKYYFEDNVSITCSIHHLVFDNGTCKKICEANGVDTIYGYKKLVGVAALSDGEVYDVALASPHEYITPNGIIHHNTTLAKALINVLKIEVGDVMFINASRENNVDTVRDKIVSFCSTWPMGEYKIIILDEFDGFGHLAQKILRGEMERYADSVRFILTANYPNKIIPALHSRLQSFHFDSLDMDTFLLRLVDILDAEHVKYETEDVVPFVNLAYPDMRKAINLLQQHVRDNTLYSLEEGQTSQDYLIEMANLFKAGKINEARRLVCSQARVEDYEDIYRFMYKNLDLFSNNEEGQGTAVMVIAKGLRNHAIVADPEINLAATFVELSRVND